MRRLPINPVRAVAVVSLVAVSALGVAVGSAVAADSSHALTITEHQHGTFTTEAANPCTGTPGTVTFDGNLVEHATYFPGKASLILTETGKVTAVFGDATFTGQETAIFRFTINERNYVETSTLNIHIYSSDGTALTAHETAHVTVNAAGQVTVQFDKMRITCG